MGGTVTYIPSFFGAGFDVTSYVGSDFSGSDGDSSRTLPVSTTPKAVFKSGQIISTSSYSYLNGTLTIIPSLFDDENVEVAT